MLEVLVFYTSPERHDFRAAIQARPRAFLFPVNVFWANRSARPVEGQLKITRIASRLGTEMSKVGQSSLDGRSDLSHAEVVGAAEFVRRSDELSVHAPVGKGNGVVVVDKYERQIRAGYLIVC